jgi:hypothetical protein
VGSQLIRLAEDRETALRVGYDATDWVRKPPYGDYEDSLSEWDVRLMEASGEPIGAVYTHGPEFHVSVVPEWHGRWATRSILRQIIPEPVAFTQVIPGYEHVVGYLYRLGFGWAGNKDGTQYFVRYKHAN